MPHRTVANNRQREFFADIAKLDRIALTTKNTDALSINIHGSFTLFDKHWSKVSDNNNETMLALKEEGLENTNREPAVHFHIDWRTIKWACIQPRHLELINTDYEIVFTSERNTAARRFWFYLPEGIETQILLAKWGNDWIKLNELDPTIFNHISAVPNHIERTNQYITN